MSFNGRWSSFFATTYSIELEFFDEYLFRRLGEPPLNATVLTDAGTHARLWISGDDQTRRLRRANRDYLLRPVLFGTGAFHPKTYLFGNASEGVLLVGSGNLTMSGVERGREVFSAFRSTKPDDVGSIRGWRQWMDGIVERLADEEVRFRWLRLRRECGDWLEGDTAGSRFIGTGERSILDQFADGVDGQVDELHAIAPFYDRDALALKALLDRFRPARLHLYLGARTSVHGPALAAVVSGFDGQVSLLEIDPPEFVHAKLVGIVAGDSRPLARRLGEPLASSLARGGRVVGQRRGLRCRGAKRGRDASRRFCHPTIPGGRRRSTVSPSSNSAPTNAHPDCRCT